MSIVLTGATRLMLLTGAAMPCCPAWAQVAATPTQEVAATTEDGDIVVTGARAARIDAINRKRALPTIADVVSSDGIGKLPDFNTAEALQRLPGVSVQVDQGEPRYVVVRGVDPNLNQVTVDGNLVGIPEAEGRRVALDTIPSDLVAAIEVVKAVTPDYDANAIGGSINIVTPTAFDRPGAFTFATARGSYNALSDKVGFGGSATHGRRFGPDETFGIVVAGSYSKRFIDSDLVEPAGWRQFTTAGVTAAAPTNFTMFDYRIMRERIGGIVNLDWRPSPATRLYLRTIYNQFTDHEERDQFNQALVAGAPAPGVVAPDRVAFPNVRATRQFRQNNQTQRLYNVSPSADLRFGGIALDVNYTYARAQEHTPVRDDLEFRSATGRTVTLDTGGRLPTFAAIDPRLYDAAAFPLRRLRMRRERIGEDLHAARADVAIDLDASGANRLQLGAKYTDRTKTRDNRQTQLDAVGTSTLAGTGAVLDAPPRFYRGAYDFGPRIDYAGVLRFYEANPALVRLNAQQTAINDATLDYRVEEGILAAYAMATLRFGDVEAIGGARVERTDARYDAFQIRAATGVAPLAFDRRYTHVLPSVHLNWRPDRTVTLRAAWTNTIGRPNYDALVPSFVEEDGAGTAGNPDLEPYTSMGLDTSAEYYPDRDSIVSVGVFYKHLRNPIFVQTVRDTSFAGIPLVSLSQPRNARSGELFGIEANAQRRLAFLPAPFDGLGVSANATLIRSRARVPGREDDRIPFFGQSDVLVNGAVFYERGAVEARVAVSHRTGFIVNVGSPVQRSEADIYEAGRTTLDARLGYRLSPRVEIFAAASNLTETPLAYYQTVRRQTYSRETYGFNADFGVSVRL